MSLWYLDNTKLKAVIKIEQPYRLGGHSNWTAVQIGRSVKLNGESDRTLFQIERPPKIETERSSKIEIGRLFNLNGHQTWTIIVRKTVLDLTIPQKLSGRS